MKKLLVLLSTVTILFAGSLEWSNDYNKRLHQAKNEGKPVLMMYHASWCPECSYMKEVIFKDPKLSEYIQSHYKLLAFDISKEKDKLPKGYSYKGVPTFFIISPDGKLLGKIEGAANATLFQQKLESIK